MMNRNVILGLACCLMAVTAGALADSFITVPNTGKRLYKWDGEYLMKPDTGKRLYKWDGTYMMIPNTGQRLLKYDGKHLMKPNTGERLAEIKGNVSVAILIAFAAGLL